MRVRLETERLILRPFELDDAIDVYYGWANDEEVTKYLTWNHHTDIEQTKQILSIWVEQYEKKERINFGIVLKENGELIGGIDVVGYIEGVPVIGYTLSRKYWGYGIMTEACNKVLDFLFSLGYTKVRIDAQVENIASNKVIIKCGGKYQDTYTEYFPNKGKNRSVNRYLVIRGE